MTETQVKIEATEGESGETLIKIEAPVPASLVNISLDLQPGAVILLGANSVVKDCQFSLARKAKLIIGAEADLSGASFSVSRKNARLEIGKFSEFNKDSRVFCDKSILIGDFALVSSGVFITDSEGHSPNAEDREREAIAKRQNKELDGKNVRSVSLIIESHCFLGMDSRILPPSDKDEHKMVVARATKLGTNAVLNTSIYEPGSTWVGLPARQTASNFPR